MSKKLSLFLALILVPVLVAGGFLWGTWNTDDRLHKVEAAVVNLDEAVTIDGQLVPLGRQLSANLVDGERHQNFTWVLADEAHAYPGLQSGRYAAVVVIPENFSKAATSYGSKDVGDAEQATIQVLTSPVAGLADGMLGTVIANAAAKTLNETLTTAYLDRIYVGFNDMGKQFTTVADGAAKLADGAAKLHDGVAQASSGARELDNGMGRLSAGSGQLRSGAAQLADGTSQLAGGLTTMKKKTAGLPSDSKKLASGTAQYVAGVNKLIASTQAQAAELPQLVSGVDQLVAGAKRLAAGAATYQGTMASLAKDPTQTGVDCPFATPEQCQAFYAGMGAGLSVAAHGSQDLVDGTDAYAAGVTDFRTQLAAMLPSQAEAAAAAQQLALLKSAGGQLVSGTKALAAGMPALTSGIAKTAGGAAKLASGARQLSGGVSAYTTGVDQAAGGAGQLADGLVALNGGAGKLADGTHKLADGLAKGASKLPNYDADEREQLAKVVASPIQTTNLDTVTSPTTALASLLLILSLWLGALATYAVIAAIKPGLALSTKSSAALLWEALTPGVIVAGAQSLVLTAIGAAVLGLGPVKIAAVLGLMVLAALAFVAVNHALAAWLGFAGRLVAVAFAVIGAASAVTSAVPVFFDAVRPFSPVTPALDGLRAILTDSPGAAGSAFTLVGWALAAVIASAAAVLRKRTVTLAEVPALR